MRPRTGSISGTILTVGTVADTPGWRKVLVGTLVLLTLAAGLIGIELSKATDTTAAWWPAAGVGVVTLFVAPRAWWPRLLVLLFLANLLANAFGGRPLDASAALGVADVVEVVIVCWAMRAAIGRHLEGISDLPWLIGVSALGAAAAGLGVAATSYLLLGGEFARTWLTTMSSHWASVMVIAPLGLLPRRSVRRAVCRSRTTSRPGTSATPVRRSGRSVPPTRPT